MGCANERVNGWKSSPFGTRTSCRPPRRATPRRLEPPRGRRRPSARCSASDGARAGWAARDAPPTSRTRRAGGGRLFTAAGVKTRCSHLALAAPLEAAAGRHSYGRLLLQPPPDAVARVEERAFCRGEVRHVQRRLRGGGGPVHSCRCGETLLTARGVKSRLRGGGVPVIWTADGAVDAAPVRPAGDWGRFREIGGDWGRLGEIAGDCGRLGEIAGDRGRWREMAGDCGRDGEIGGDWGRLRACGLRHRRRSSAGSPSRSGSATA